MNFPVRRLVPALLAGAMLCTMTACSESDDAAATGADGPVPPLSSAGRWFTDAHGRVVLLRGFNEVAKSPPFYPAAFGFGDDDADFLAAEGFNALRLGVDFRGLMPEPGSIDDKYIEQLATTVDSFTGRGFFVILDFHQDGFAPVFNGNGFPDWMAISDGLPNPPDAVFPLYYVQNPAMQRAFENFWDNRSGPNGVGLQDYFVQGLERVVARFADNEWVIGVELMNEPWPGSVWEPCVVTDVGCPDLERALLRPFYEKGATAARQIAPHQLVLVEPFVLFNFGQGPTTIPGDITGTALSFHSYALDLAGEERVLAYGVAAAERDRVAAVVTEFGATIDPVILHRITAQMDAQLLSWLDWAYNESIIADPSRPAGEDNLRSEAAFGALVRPYPVALAGTPELIGFDPTTKRFELRYTTSRPDGGSYPRELLSVVSVPSRQYPNGYAVTVDGAAVTSVPNSALLTLQTESDRMVVSVVITSNERRAQDARAWPGFRP
jgi:endoglycosylceramidase